MAGSGREAIETFMRITGACESLARRKLEEYGGNISAAVNAHFGEGYNYNAYYANSNGGTQGGQQGLLPLLNAARRFRFSSLLDPNYRRHLFDQIHRSPMIGPPASVSQPGSLGTIPPESNSLPDQPPHLAQRLFIGIGDRTSYSTHYQETGSDTEDEMIKAAIEASKQNSEHSQEYLHQEDDDLARALSLSLRMAEEERAIRELLANKDEQPASVIGKGESSNTAPKPKGCKGEASFHNHQEEGVSHSEEWGGITSKEFNDSVLLEASLFGDNSKRSLDTSLPVSLLQNNQNPGTSTGGNLQLVPYLLPFPTAQQAKGQQEAMGRSSAAQEASFPPKPEINGEDTVSILLRMPDGRRQECHFLKSDQLQLLFNFINEKMGMKPHTYKVVKPYPRCAFGVEDGSMTLRELGFTGKQEALFIELL